MLAGIPLAQLEGIVLQDPQTTEKVHDVLEQYRQNCDRCRAAFEEQVSRFDRGMIWLPASSRW
jgi:DNA-directed RNA polymerase subunit beta